MALRNRIAAAALGPVDSRLLSEPQRLASTEAKAGGAEARTSSNRLGCQGGRGFADMAMEGSLTGA